MIEIEIDMAEITPESKVKLTLKDAIIIIIAIASATGWALDYFGVISNQAHGQVVTETLSKKEVEEKYATKEKLQDTVDLVNYRLNDMEKKFEELKQTVIENQKETNQKLDILLRRDP